MPRPIVRVAERKVFENRYGALFNDEVLSPAGRPGNYLRWRWSGGGVVIVPCKGDLVALSAMYRYPIGAVSIELPRGGIDAGETAEVAALRELREEFGLVGRDARGLGTLVADSGLIENPISVVAVEVIEGDAAPMAEAMESVARGPRWWRRDEIRAAVRDGTLRCAISVAALARAAVL